MARPASEETVEQEVAAQEYTVANPITKKGRKFVCIGRNKIATMVDYITTLFEAAGVPELFISVKPTTTTIRVKIDDDYNESEAEGDGE